MEQEGGALRLHAVRFWHDSLGTVVVGIFRVPLTALEVSGGGLADSAVYVVEVTVLDEAERVLHRDSWRQALPAGALALAERGGEMRESFIFAAPLRRYAIQVQVRDSVSGTVLSAGTSLESYSVAPPLSDLVVASAIHELGAEGMMEPGAIQRGRLAIVTGNPVAIQPSDPVLYYYAELYQEDVDEGLDSARVQLRIVDEEGRVLVATRPRVHPHTPSAVPGGIAGRLNVRGLPPGNYRLVMEVQSPDTVVERVAEFRMAERDQRASLERDLFPVSERYAEMSEAALDSLFLPLSYILTEHERASYAGLPLDGKRRFFTWVFRRRDPTPDTPDNPFEDEFWRRLEYVEANFRERGMAGRPGWATDRGRIYLKYGAPEDVYVSPMGAGGRAWQVWKYTKTHTYRYLFWDETGFENYVLLHTDNRTEPGRPNWEAIAGPEAAEEIRRVFY